MGIETVVLAVLSLLVLVQLVLGWKQSQRIQQLERTVAQYAISQQKQLESVSNTILSLHVSIHELEQRLEKSTQRHQSIENKNAGSLTYDQAANLVQMGAAP